MPLVRKTIHIEKYNKSNKSDFEGIMYKHTYLTDLKDFNFDIFPQATIYFIRGDLWLIKDIIMGFGLIIDCKEMSKSEKHMQAIFSEIDYRSFDTFDGIILHEIGVAERFRAKGLGSLLLSAVIDDTKGRDILIKAEDDAVKFWLKKGFEHVEQTKLNNMIFINRKK